MTRTEECDEKKGRKSPYPRRRSRENRMEPRDGSSVIRVSGDKRHHERESEDGEDETEGIIVLPKIIQTPPLVQRSNASLLHSPASPASPMHPVSQPMVQKQQRPPPTAPKPWIVAKPGIPKTPPEASLNPVRFSSIHFIKREKEEEKKEKLFGWLLSC